MRADRLVALLLLLQIRGRTTARDLAARLEVSERTIYRDLDALCAAGVPVVVEPGRYGGCRLMEGYHTDLTGLNETEVRTLFAARTTGHLADLGLTRAGDTALVKLTAALPAISRPGAERALARVHLDADLWFHTAEEVPFLSVVQEAVWQERALHLVYRGGTGAGTDGVVEPLGLVAKARTWYLVAREAGDMRVFRIARIQEATLLDEHFTRPEGFDLRAFWTAWRDRFERSIPRYPVTVRVAPAALDQLQRLLGEEVVIDRAGAKPDSAGGWIMLVTFERFDDARRALLGCGTLVEALAPRELRESIADSVARLANLYSPLTAPEIGATV